MGIMRIRIIGVIYDLLLEWSVTVTRYNIYIYLYIYTYIHVYIYVIYQQLFSYCITFVGISQPSPQLNSANTYTHHHYLERVMSCLPTALESWARSIISMRRYQSNTARMRQA